MKIVIASDSYKGCLSSCQVADSVRSAILDVYPECEVVSLNLADGGEGTVSAIMNNLGGDIIETIVSDPLGRKIKASYGRIGNLAVIESASACGLTLLSEKERNPLITSSKGLGELILNAVECGCNRFVIGLGGTATNDGGMGMLSIEGILEKTKGMNFTIACDVDVPFVGPNSTSRIYAPQKGASIADIEILENRLLEFSYQIEKDTGVNVRNIPGAGAAGGLGGSFMAYFNGKLKSGIEIVLEIARFDEIISDADLVITGEGCSDHQTINGKAPFGVLNHCKELSIPVALVSGMIKDESLLRNSGFSIIERVTPDNMPLSLAMQIDVAKNNIYEAVRRLFKVDSES